MALAAFAASRGSPGPALAGGMFDFPFEDKRWLGAGQVDGGRAIVPDGLPDVALPLLVWLHGNNEGGPMHRGLGDGTLASDLSGMPGVGSLPMVIAGPSQTKNAADAGLWAGFDLDAFVDAVEGATGRRIDRERVVLAGHSGAGCSQVGGLLSLLGDVKPRKLVNIDGCMSEGYGQLFGMRGEVLPVEVYYQTRSWARDFAAFKRGFAGRGLFQEVSVPSGGNPHEDIVAIALAEALR